MPAALDRADAHLGILVVLDELRVWIRRIHVADDDDVFLPGVGVLQTNGVGIPVQRQVHRVVEVGHVPELHVLDRPVHPAAVPLLLERVSHAAPPACQL